MSCVTFVLFIATVFRENLLLILQNKTIDATALVRPVIRPEGLFTSEIKASKESSHVFTCP